MTTTAPETQVSQDIHAPRHFATVGSSDLTSALADVNALVSSRPAVPALHGVRLTTSGHQLFLARTDLDVTARATIAAAAPGIDTVLVGARALAALTRAIGPGVDITLTLLQRNGESWMRIAGDGVTYQLHLMDLNQYPSLAGPGGEFVAEVSAEDFAALATASGATSRDETLPILTGVRLRELQGSLVAMATDRYRLTEVNTLHPVPAGFSALVRRSVIDHVAKVARRDGAVTIAQVDGYVTFTVGGRTFSSQTVDGEYPKVEALWPTRPADTTAGVDRADLARAVRRVITATGNLPISLNFVGASVVVSGEVEGDLDATTSVACDIAGEPREIRLNPQYLLDGIATLGGSCITFSLQAQTNLPAVMTGDDSRVRHLLMLVRQLERTHR